LLNFDARLERPRLSTFGSCPDCVLPGAPSLDPETGFRRYDSRSQPPASTQITDNSQVIRGPRYYFGLPTIGEFANHSSCESLFPRFWIPRRFPHASQYGPFRKVEAQHLSFSMNQRRAPGGILGHHAEDELAEFNADALPAGANSMPREPGPIEPEAGAVPSHH
jgi:hypothetical protein